MFKLPNWCITKNKPGFYDTESATVIEQTAKLYAAMQEMIDDYNTFVETITDKMNRFINITEHDQELYRSGLRQEFQDFIDSIDLKLKNLELNFKYSESSLEKQYNSFLADAKSALDEFHNDVKNIQATVKTQTKEDIQAIIDDMHTSGEINEILGDSITNFDVRVSNVESKVDGIENGSTATTDTYAREMIDELKKHIFATGVVIFDNSLELSQGYMDVNPSLYLQCEKIVVECFSYNDKDKPHKLYTCTNGNGIPAISEVTYSEDGTSATFNVGDTVMNLPNAIIKWGDSSGERITHIANYGNYYKVLIFRFNELRDSWYPTILRMDDKQINPFNNGEITLEDCKFYLNNEAADVRYISGIL